MYLMARKGRREVLEAKLRVSTLFVRHFLIWHRGLFPASDLVRSMQRSDATASQGLFLGSLTYVSGFGLKVVVFRYAVGCVNLWSPM